MSGAEGGSIATIGYAGATQDGLITALREADVELLVDVRALANSRRPGFSKNSLRAASEEAGIGYRHLRQLGTPKEGREAARRGDIAGLNRVYQGQLALPEALAELAELVTLARTSRVCLLCYCAERTKCHRGLLIEGLPGAWTVRDLEPSSIV